MHSTFSFQNWRYLNENKLVNVNLISIGLLVCVFIHIIHINPFLFDCNRHCICSSSWNWIRFLVRRISHFIIIRWDRERLVYWSIIWMGIFCQAMELMDRKVNIVARLQIKGPPSMCYHGIYECAHKRIFVQKVFLRPWTIVSIEICTGKLYVSLPTPLWQTISELYMQEY